MTKAPILSREARLSWARGILADVVDYSDARLRRACLTVLNHAPSNAVAERDAASAMLSKLEPITQQKEDGRRRGT